MANRVVQLNKKELKNWNRGLYYKCLTRVKNPYYEGDICEIRNPKVVKLGYAKIIKVQKAEPILEIYFEDINHYKAFQANMPPAPIVTMLTFELLDKWEGQG